ncbi:MAG: delta-aminolevulinic acid dehydratase, partial [Candidatus Hodarchaeota archaeon]
DILEKLKSEGYSGYCWGYNFPWQNRERFLPIYTPTIVNTSFIGHAFLDAHESLGIGQYLDIAKSSCQFILEDLRPVLETENELCLSYTPYDEERIYNSNMLGASLLARVYQHTRDERLLSSAKRIVNFVRNAQRPDGSWYYGEARTQTWIDIFHTGFVLEGLFDYMTATADMQILPVIEKGLQFFKNNFFLQDERMKLWHDKNYPIDIHSVQAIIVLVKLRNIQDSYHLLKNITSWMIDHMQDKKGYFYFRKERFLYNKISYMRWSQSWALHALTTYLQYLKEHNTND